MVEDCNDSIIDRTNFMRGILWLNTWQRNLNCKLSRRCCEPIPYSRVFIWRCKEYGASRNMKTSGWCCESILDSGVWLQRCQEPLLESGLWIQSCQGYCVSLHLIVEWAWIWRCQDFVVSQSLYTWKFSLKRKMSGLCCETVPDSWALIWRCQEYVVSLHTW